MKRPLLLCLLLLCSCKSNSDQQANPDRPPGPPTMLGQHMTPAYMAVGLYVRTVKMNAASAFLNSGDRPFTATCDDPALNVQVDTGQAKVESCNVKVSSLDDIQVAARISNGWLIVSDAQSTRRVKASEFPQLGN